MDNENSNINDLAEKVVSGKMSIEEAIIAIPHNPFEGLQLLGMPNASRLVSYDDLKGERPPISFALGPDVELNGILAGESTIIFVDGRTLRGADAERFLEGEQ